MTVPVRRGEASSRWSCRVGPARSPRPPARSRSPAPSTVGGDGDVHPPVDDGIHDATRSRLAGGVDVADDGGRCPAQCRPDHRAADRGLGGRPRPMPPGAFAGRAVIPSMHLGPLGLAFRPGHRGMRGAVRDGAAGRARPGTRRSRARPCSSAASWAATSDAESRWSPPTRPSLTRRAPVRSAGPGRSRWTDQWRTQDRNRGRRERDRDRDRIQRRRDRPLASRCRRRGRGSAPDPGPGSGYGPGRNRPWPPPANDAVRGGRERDRTRSHRPGGRKGNERQHEQQGEVRPEGAPSTTRAASSRWWWLFQYVPAGEAQDVRRKTAASGTRSPRRNPGEPVRSRTMIVIRIASRRRR